VGILEIIQVGIAAAKKFPLFNSIHPNEHSTKSLFNLYGFRYPISCVEGVKANGRALDCKHGALADWVSARAGQANPDRQIRIAGAPQQTMKATR
jgi:hypothetical protein